MTPEARALKDRLAGCLADGEFRFHPEEKIVQRVLGGLLRRLATTGKAYCPCRMLTNRAELDEKIVCPCAFHEEEILGQGHCYCRLFVARDFVPGADRRNAASA